ncbi:ketohydroxyglutarate aldolase [Enterococcus gallinarum]|uniref:ketohydroxyglutarate aldolase n=1 Tax=Enterococcus gallinarum TaxID=1353 RepID=UPI002DB64CB4|nr:ketohydroxyglutarate aldolase [Enterococcus gallinarum]MEB6064586.1 ketohydroxyglutarate aldolase [Enterococcus gallinarum]
MKKMSVTQRIYQTGALAIVRTESFERACEIADGCIAGGVPVMEMSYTLNSAGDIIKKLTEKYGDQLCVGAGTVFDSETARHAILHGAQFIIAPNYSKEVAKICNRYQIPYAPGCTSFTEAVDSLGAGAAFIKAFPISDFYGSKLVTVFKTPIPDMPILASGGINLENIETWLQRGVDVCGIGSLLTKGTVAEIRTNAEAIHTVVQKYRK